MGCHNQPLSSSLCASWGSEHCPTPSRCSPQALQTWNHASGRPQVNPDSPAALVSAGNVHLAAGEAEAALQRYEDALAADRQCLQALYNAGWAAGRAGGVPAGQAVALGGCGM